MRFWRRLSLLLLGGAFSLGIAAAERQNILAATPISRLDLAWWRVRHAAKLKEIAATQPKLVFLGDSITQNWERSGPPDWQDFKPVWQRFYGDRQAVNLGFKGDTTASLLWRIGNGEVASIAPTVAVILIGANNLGKVHWSAYDTVVGIDAVIHELHQRLPATRLLLLAVLPSERSSWITETTAQINQMLAVRYQKDPTVSFLDLTNLFMRDGRLDQGLFLDSHLIPPDPPLHPSAQGAALMAKAMEPMLSSMLGDRLHR